MTKEEIIDETGDETLLDFIKNVSNAKLAVPEIAIKHIMNKNGVDVSDPMILKIVSLATQKFISNIASESLHNTMVADSTIKKQEKEAVFKMEDLIPILEENGIKINKLPYFE